MMCPRSGQVTAEDGSVTLQKLLSQVVSDFDVLYRAYARAGLLAEETHTETAQKLLGSGDDVYRFKRAFLLAEALIWNRVGRLVYGSNDLRYLAVFGGNNVGKSTVVNSWRPRGGKHQP